MTTDDTRPLSAEEVGSVRRLHPDGACDHAYSGCREAQWVATLDAERARHAATLNSLEQLTARHAALVAAARTVVVHYFGASPDVPMLSWSDVAALQDAIDGEPR
jgi:hypothetical protein